MRAACVLLRLERALRLLNTRHGRSRLFVRLNNWHRYAGLIGDKGGEFVASGCLCLQRLWVTLPTIA